MLAVFNHGFLLMKSLRVYLYKTMNIESNFGKIFFKDDFLHEKSGPKPAFKKYLFGRKHLEMLLLLSLNP